MTAELREQEMRKLLGAIEHVWKLRRHWYANSVRAGRMTQKIADERLAKEETRELAKLAKKERSL